MLWVGHRSFHCGASWYEGVESDIANWKDKQNGPLHHVCRLSQRNAVMTGSHALGNRWVLVCLCFLGCSGSSGLFPGKELAWTRLDVEVAGPRMASAMVWDPVRRTFVLHAGQDVDWNLRPETWEWSPNSAAWRLIVDQSQQNPGPRMSHAMVWDPTRERMILFAGTGPRSLLRRHLGL